MSEAGGSKFECGLVHVPRKICFQLDLPNTWMLEKSVNCECQAYQKNLSGKPNTVSQSDYERASHVPDLIRGVISKKRMSTALKLNLTKSVTCKATVIIHDDTFT